MRKPRIFKNYKVGIPKEYPAVTAREISKASAFIEKCVAIGVKPTVRQARDYRRGIGRFA